MTKILMFSGSSRKESLNKKLVAVTAEIATGKQGVVTNIDLNDYRLPIYNGDFEQEHGPPKEAKELHQLIESHDALVIASPEYNGLPSALLKNTIDWVSRVSTAVFENKTAAIMSASPGRLGGLRGLTHLRTLLNNLNTLVIPQQVAVGKAFDAFDDGGNLIDSRQRTMLETMIDVLLVTANRSLS